MWAEKDGWTRKFRMGDLWVPCGVTLEDNKDNRIKMGGEVRHGEYVWKVVELSEF